MTPYFLINNAFTKNIAPRIPNHNPTMLNRVSIKTRLAKPRVQPSTIYSSFC